VRLVFSSIMGLSPIRRMRLVLALPPILVKRYQIPEAYKSYVTLSAKL
jgi:hypothetical protein